MNGVIYNNDGSSIPVKMWVELSTNPDKKYNIEDGALQQINHLARLPFAFHHVAIMPDCHSGYGMPIGGVLATEGAIIPNAVGVDIGCGMCAVKTSLKAEKLDLDILKMMMRKILEIVPVGFNHQKEDQPRYLMPIVYGDKELLFGTAIIHKEFHSALKQLGTLGGGNHFIEIQKDQEGFVWVMIHSGSRNLGKKVADHYNKIAMEMNERYYSSVPKEWELAFLPIKSQEAKDYLLEMRFCVDFALANRKLMMERIVNIFAEQIPNLSFPDPIINIAHNYAAWEHHFGKDVIVHRKGATLAREGTIGIIPGSQGTKSYIVKGLGNSESFMSCSHGAGRKMGRNQACKTLNLEEEIRKMDEKGIIHGIRSAKNLDEAPGSYKDIDVVMENQKDLVEILVTLEPLAVIKGD